MFELLILPLKPARRPLLLPPRFVRLSAGPFAVHGHGTMGRLQTSFTAEISAQGVYKSANSTDFLRPVRKYRKSAEITQEGPEFFSFFCQFCRNLSEKF